MIVTLIAAFILGCLVGRWAVIRAVQKHNDRYVARLEAEQIRKIRAQAEFDEFTARITGGRAVHPILGDTWNGPAWRFGDPVPEVFPEEWDS